MDQRQTTARRAPQQPAAGAIALRDAGPDVERLLRRTLFGRMVQADFVALPPLSDLAGSLIALAEGARRKVLLPLIELPTEFALVRRGVQVLVSYYRTGNDADVYVLNQPVDLEPLLAVTADALMAQAARLGDMGQRRACQRLAERTRQTHINPRPQWDTPLVHRSGGALSGAQPSGPLAFGFSVTLDPASENGRELPERSDLHAMLFDGTLWAYVRERRVPLASGPIMLLLEALLRSSEQLLDAEQQSRALHVQTCVGPFVTAVRLQRAGAVALTIGMRGAGHAPITIPALTVKQTIVAVLRLTSELVRTLLAVDRSQQRNLRLLALREVAHDLYRRLRESRAAQSQVAADPDRLRSSSNPPPPQREVLTPLLRIPSAGRVRYVKRWHIDVEELNAGRVTMTSDLLVIPSPQRIVALSKRSGDGVWIESERAEHVLCNDDFVVTLGTDSMLRVRDAADGRLSAETRVSNSHGSRSHIVLTSGQEVPPLAIVTSDQGKLLAVDVRTGEVRWRIGVSNDQAVRMRQVGRLLLLSCGEPHIDAIDLATGELAWRYVDAASVFSALTTLESTVIALSIDASVDGPPQCKLTGIDLFSGKLTWTTTLPGVPVASPRTLRADAATGSILFPLSAGTQGTLTSVDVSGALRWSVPFPNLSSGVFGINQNAGSIVVADMDRSITCLEPASGKTRWTRALEIKSETDTARQLEPVVRGDLAFVPADRVAILHTTRGNDAGELPECDLIPDYLHVDQDGWVYVAEESGHVAAFAPEPFLQLVR